MMKKPIQLVVTLVAALVLYSPAGWAAPKVHLDSAVYEFSKVLEGVHISHAFIVRNTGDAPLTITSVQPP